jgi:hypothetical protein
VVALGRAEAGRIADAIEATPTKDRAETLSDVAIELA